MKQGHRFLALASLTAIVGSAGSASADVLCKTRKGVVVVRAACKRKETRLDRDSLGIHGAQAPTAVADHVDRPGGQA